MNEAYHSQNMPFVSALLTAHADERDKGDASDGPQQCIPYDSADAEFVSCRSA